jgi:aminoglycoside phosphotransferase (APT) family kinase protein
MAWARVSSLGHRIVRDKRFAGARKLMTAQCGRILADIHRVDGGGLPALPVKSPAGMTAELLASFDAIGQCIPVFELAFRWLADRAGQDVGNSLVHGDFRNGNFIVDDSGIVQVLDWEMAHLGDPLEDLGWLCMNAWRFGAIDKPVGGFGNRAELYAAYEQARGERVNPERVRFWEVFGTLKWGLVCQWFAQQFTSGEVRSIERAAIGRRVSEVELDLLDLIEGVE